MASAAWKTESARANLQNKHLNMHAKAKYFIASCLSLFLFSFVLLQSAHAQGIRDALGILTDKTAPKAGVTDKADLATVVGDIINTGLALVGMIFLILMVYGGFLWMAARGEEDQVKKAQLIIKTTIIGMIVVVSAYAITTFITSRFGSA